MLSSYLTALAAGSLGLSGPQFPVSTNWLIATQPPTQNSGLKNTISVNADGSLGWNGSPIVDDQLRTYTGITSQMRPGITTILVLRTGVSEERRDELIRFISEANACQGDHKCVLIENWPTDFPAYVPPPPPAPPRKRSQ